MGKIVNSKGKMSHAKKASDKSKSWKHGKSSGKAKD